MSIAQKLKSMVGMSGNGVDFTTYRCTECDHVFDSAQTEERVQCPECLAREVEVAAEAAPAG